MSGISTQVPPRPEILDAKCKCGHIASEHVVTPGDMGLHIGTCMHLTLASGLLAVHEPCPCGEFEHVPFVAEPNMYVGMSLAQWQELRDHVAAVDRLLQAVSRMAGPR